MSSRRTIKPPRRYADDAEYYQAPSPKLPRRPRCTIPGFPGIAQIIQYNPDGRPASFPSLDWLEQQGLPQPSPLHQQPIGVSGTSSATTVPTETNSGPKNGHRNVSGSKFTRNQSKNTAVTSNGVAVSGNTDNGSLSEDVLRATGTHGTFEAVAGRPLAEMDTSDEEQSEGPDIQWSDISCSLQARICANLAVLTKTNVAKSIEILSLSRVDAELALYHYDERQRRLAQEHAVSVQIIQDQLVALLRRDGRPNLQADHEEHQKIFEQHFKSSIPLLQDEHLVFTLQDLAKAEKYLSKHGLDIRIAHQDLGPAPDRGTIVPTVSRKPPVTQGATAAQALEEVSTVPTQMSGTSDAQAVGNTRSPREQQQPSSKDLTAPNWNRLSAPRLNVEATPNTRTASSSTLSTPSLLEGSGAEEENSSRRKGLRSGRERRMTEKAREAIESGMSVPGGTNISMFQERRDEQDGTHITDEVPIQIETDRNVRVGGETSKNLSPSQQNPKIKLKLDEAGQAVLRKHEAREERAQDQIRKIRRDVSGTRREAQREHQVEPPVTREVISRQGSPADSHFARITQEELECARATTLKDPGRQQTSLGITSQTSNSNQPGRRIGVLQPSSPLSLQSRRTSHEVPVCQPVVTIQASSGPEKRRNDLKPHVAGQEGQNFPEHVRRQSLTQQDSSALNALQPPRQVTQRSSTNKSPHSNAASTSLQNHNYERFTFPFVEPQAIQPQQKPTNQCNEGNTSEYKHPDSVLPKVQHHETEPRSSACEALEVHPVSDSNGTQEIQRSSSLPPQMPLRGEVVDSDRYAKEVAELYASVNKLIANNETLGSDPAISKRNLKIIDAIAEQSTLSTKSPTEQANVEILDQNAEHSKGDEEAAATAVLRHQVSTPSPSISAVARNHGSPDTGGWQPESIAIAKKAGILVSGENSDMSVDATTSPTKSDEVPLSALKKSPDTTETAGAFKNEQRFSPQTGKVVDVATENRSESGPSPNRHSISAPKKTGDKGQSKRTAMTQVAKSNMPTSKPALGTAQEQSSKATSPDHNQKSTTVPATVAQPKAKIRKRTRSKTSPASPGTSPPRKIQTLSKIATSRAKHPSNPVHDSPPTPMQNSDMKPLSQSHAEGRRGKPPKRTSSNLSSNSTVEVVSHSAISTTLPPAAKDQMPKEEALPAGKKLGHKKQKLRSFELTSDTKSEQTSPAEPRIRDKDDNSQTSPLTRSKTTTSSAHTPTKKKIKSKDPSSSENSISASTFDSSPPKDAITPEESSSPASNDLPSSPLQGKAIHRKPPMPLRTKPKTDARGRFMKASSTSTTKEVKSSEMKEQPPAPPEKKKKKTAREVELEAEAQMSAADDSPVANRTRRRTATPSAFAATTETKSLAKPSLRAKAGKSSSSGNGEKDDGDTGSENPAPKQGNTAREGDKEKGKVKNKVSMAPRRSGRLMERVEIDD